MKLINMFSKKELNLLNKIIPDQQFLDSDQGIKAAQKGRELAAKDAARY